MGERIPKELIVTSHGSIEVYLLQDGRQMTLDLIEGGGTIFYQNSILSNSVSPFHLKAKEDTHAIKIAKDSLMALKDKFPNLDEQIAVYLEKKKPKN